MVADTISNIVARIQIKQFFFIAWLGIKSIDPKKLAASSLPFICYLIIFSFNKGISHVTGLDKIVKPNYLILDRIERTLFLCHPHKVLSSFANPVFDFFAAVPYLVHFPLPVLYGLYLLITPKKRLYIYQYVWLAGWVNLLAVLFQIGCPTAPPWFVDSAVFDDNQQIVYTSPVEGGFNRLDSVLGISLFHGLYSQSPLPFGAFPSLHCAWPAVILWSYPWGGWKVGVFHVMWISLSAMYITHHYLIDVLGGVLLASFVRLCIVKIGSPFPELADNNSTKKLLTFSV